MVIGSNVSNDYVEAVPVESVTFAYHPDEDCKVGMHIGNIQWWL